KDGIRDFHVTGVQTCALPISPRCTGSTTLSGCRHRPRRPHPLRESLGAPDHRTDRMTMTPEQKRSAKEGFAHAKNSMQALERDYPGLWAQLDRMRAERPVEWPDWCLLPMGAAVAVAQTNPLALKDHT